MSKLTFLGQKLTSAPPGGRAARHGRAATAPSIPPGFRLSSDERQHVEDTVKVLGRRQAALNRELAAIAEAGKFLKLALEKDTSTSAGDPGGAASEGAGPSNKRPKTERASARRSHGGSDDE